jgi:hypothetical protein
MTHHDAIRQFAKMPRNLDQWLDKAAAHSPGRSTYIGALPRREG